MIIAEIILILFILALSYYLKQLLQLNKMYKKLEYQNPEDDLGKLENSLIKSIEQIAPVKSVKSTTVWISVAIVIALVVLICMILYQFKVINVLEYL